MSNEEENEKLPERPLVIDLNAAWRYLKSLPGKGKSLIQEILWIGFIIALGALIFAHFFPEHLPVYEDFTSLVAHV